MKLSDISHIEQYAGPWAIDEETMQSLVSYAQNLDLDAHVAAYQARDIPKPGAYFVREDGIAVIDLKGAMTKYGSSLSDMPHGTIGVKKALHEAAKDDSVKGILLSVESGGGSVNGTDSLALKVAKVAKQKPLCAVVEEMAASAAFWVTAQAPHLIANPTARIGSIGIYTVIEDHSALYKEKGIKTHVIKTGAYKGIGEKGTELTEDQIAKRQADLDAMNEIFIDRVATGRNLSTEQVREVADGRVLLAAAAHSLGLIDQVGDFADGIAYLTSQIAGSRMKGKPMSDKKSDVAAIEPATNEPKAETPGPASYKELKAALPGADASFLCAQQEREATLTQAQQAYMKHLEAENAELKESKAALEKSKAADVGNEPLGGGGKAEESGGDAVGEWQSAVADYAKDNGCSKQDAAYRVGRQNPELRKAYIAAAQGK